jgi:YfiH family protein
MFSEVTRGALVYLTSSLIPAPHAFTTRYGGVSTGIYASLNLGQNLGDEEARVRDNYKRIGDALGFESEKLVFSRQVHGTDIRPCTSADIKAPYEAVPYEADGLVTSQPDVPLIIFTADCVPILLCDPVQGVIAAVHAGWRGTVADIAALAARKMTDEYGCRAENIRAAIGPCISGCCFETGPEVVSACRTLLGECASRFMIQRDEKYMVDLKGINAYRLRQAGLTPEHIDVSPACTACESDKFWSHRKTNGKRGSQAALIMMKGSTNRTCQ